MSEWVKVKGQVSGTEMSIRKNTIIGIEQYKDKDETVCFINTTNTGGYTVCTPLEEIMKQLEEA